VLVETIAVGVCGTDREIAQGEYGEAPPGAERLIIGHESLGRVVDAPAGAGFEPGDHVVGIVRRPDPVPCAACAVGEWDMCRNGQYTERGIKGLHGFCSERYRIEPEFAVKVDAGLGLLGVLLEPTTVVAKAWAHIDHIAERSASRPRTVLVTGAGPIGLLAALLGVQRGLSVRVADHATDGPKPALVDAMGATYSAGEIAAMAAVADVVLECTGVARLVVDVMANNAPGSIVCLTGVSSSRVLEVDVGELNRSMVLENDVVFGSVNANRSHYEAAAAALAVADRDWLQGLITRRVPLADWAQALDKQPGDIKAVIEIS
jgi:threonine dehydrogenase-like Zn-dependent dehydrogenase